MTIIVPKAKAPSGEINPNPQVRASLAPAGAFDSGIPKVVDAIEKVYLEEKGKADNTAFFEADLKAAKAAAETDSKYKKTYVGKDAAGASRDADAEYNKSLGEIADGLSNDTQKAMFARSSSSRRAALYTSMEHHSSGEIQKYTNQVTETYVGQAKNDAAAAADLYKPGDAMGATIADQNIEISIQRQQAALTSHAKNNGFDDMWVAEKSKALASATHRSVVEVMLAKGNDLMAKDYFKIHEKEIVGADDIKSINSQLHIGNVRGESQRQHDKVMMSVADWEGRNKAANEITDPDIRKATVALLDESFGREKRFETQRKNDNFIIASSDAEKAGTVRVIKPDIWYQMSPHERTAIEQRLKHMKEGTEPSHDSKVWTEFMFKPAQELAKLTDADMLRMYRPVFDNTHYDNALRQVTAIREAAGKGDTAHLSAMQTDKETVNNAYLLYKKKDGYKDLNGTEREELMRFSDAASVAVQRLELAKGRKATDEEKQTEIRKTLTKEVFIDSWGRDKKLPAIVVSEDDKKRAYIPAENIAPNVKGGLVNWARSKGIIPQGATQAEAEAFLGRRLERAAAAGELNMSDDAIIEILNDGPKMIKKGGR